MFLVTCHPNGRTHSRNSPRSPAVGPFASSGQILFRRISCILQHCDASWRRTMKSLPHIMPFSRLNVRSSLWDRRWMEAQWCLNYAFNMLRCCLASRRNESHRDHNATLRCDLLMRSSNAIFRYVPVILLRDHLSLSGCLLQINQPCFNLTSKFTDGIGTQLPTFSVKRFQSLNLAVLSAGKRQTA